jgi:hypothetical protein
MDWATFWATFSQTHLVALDWSVGRIGEEKKNKAFVFIHILNMFTGEHMVFSETF